MKNLILILLLAAGLSAGAQNFEKVYPYWQEAGSDAVLIFDDGYAMFGFGAKTFGENYLFIIRTDLYGDTLWTRQLDIGNMGQEISYISSCARDSDGNIYLAPSSADSADLIKISPDWEILWMRKYDPDIEINCITITRDNNLLLACGSYPDERRLYKTNLHGDIIWQSVFLPEPYEWSSYINSPSIIEMPDDNIVLISVFTSNSFFRFSEINYFTREGDTISSFTIGWAIQNAIADNDNLLCVARFVQYKQDDNILTKFSPDGTMLWNKPLNFGSNNVVPSNLLQKPNKEIIVTGIIPNYPNPDMVIIQAFTEAGDSLWSSAPMSSYEIWPFGFSLCNDGGYVVSGYTSADDVKYAPFLLKTDSLGVINTIGIKEYNNNNAIKIYPNPASEYVVFEYLNSSADRTPQTISITDIFGRTVTEIPVSGEKTLWQTIGITPGVYLYRINNGGLIATGKLMISK